MTHAPRQSFALASLLDNVSGKLGRGDTSFWRRGVLYGGIFHPSEHSPFPALATGPDPVSLRPPMLLVSFHLGPIEAIGALLEQLPGDVLAFVDRDWPPVRRVSAVSVAGGQWQRAAATKLAADTLRSDGFVFCAVDGKTANARVQATVLGRPVSWARSSFDLARLTNSPMVPVIASWRGRRVEIVAGEPIPPGEASAMTATLARWLQRYLLGTVGARPP